VIAVVGESLFDAHIDGDGFGLFPGGGPFNTSVALARLGIRVCYLGAVSRHTACDRRPGRDRAVVQLLSRRDGPRGAWKAPLSGLVG
jgi:hypothetical protein